MPVAPNHLRPGVENIQRGPDPASARIRVVADPAPTGSPHGRSRRGNRRRTWGRVKPPRAAIYQKTLRRQPGGCDCDRAHGRTAGGGAGSLVPRGRAASSRPAEVPRTSSRPSSRRARVASRSPWLAPCVPGGSPIEWAPMNAPAANSDPLTPLSLLQRTLRVFPQKTALVHGRTRQSWQEFGGFCGRFAGALERARVGPGDRVALLAPNVPALLAAHFAVPRLGAALVTVNTRLSPAEVGYILDHSGAKVVLVDPELASKRRGGAGRPARTPEAREPRGSRVGRRRDAARGAVVRRVPGRRARAGDGCRRRRRRPHAVDQLHVGHDGTPEGRDLHAPRRAAERARRGDRAPAGARLRLPVDPAALPLQRLVLPVGGDGRWRART